MLSVSIPMFIFEEKKNFFSKLVARTALNMVSQA